MGGKVADVSNFHRISGKHCGGGNAELLCPVILCGSSEDMTPYLLFNHKDILRYEIVINKSALVVKSCFRKSVGNPYHSGFC